MAWPAWLRLAAFVLLLTGLTAAVGGWLSLGRIDPALVLPWAGLAAILTRPMLGWRGSLVVGAGCGLLLAALAWRLTIMPTVGEVALQALVAAGAVAAALALAAWLARVNRGAVRIILGAIAAVLWWVTGTVILDAAYVMKAGPPVDVVLVTSLPLDDDRDADARAASGGNAIADQLSGAARPTAIMRWLAGVHRVERPADLAAALADLPRDSASTALLLAHPPALDPAALVAIDRFVRSGGSAVLLADAQSLWPPPHPIGNPLNPPVTSLLTPLLAHWGLHLLAPDRDERVAALSLGGIVHRVRLRGSARIAIADGAHDARCRLVGNARGADCRIGKGRALVLSDADWLHARQWQGGPGDQQAAQATTGPHVSGRHLERGSAPLLLDVALGATDARTSGRTARPVPLLRPLIRR